MPLHSRWTFKLHHVPSSITTRCSLTSSHGRVPADGNLKIYDKTQGVQNCMRYLEDVFA